MKSFVLATALVATVSAAPRTSPPAGAVTVCATGKCDFKTVQAAVDATKTGSIFIHKGTYNEKVTIPGSAKGLEIYGETTDTSSYAGNVVSVEYKMSQASGAKGNKETAALVNEGTDVSLYNINIKNTYGKGSQAIALAAYNKQQGYYGVGLYGYQDTLLAQQGTQFYANSYIEGATDFIFGQEAAAWITNSTLAVKGSGYITASGRSTAASPSYFVITDSAVTKAKGASVAKGAAYLGRPWREYARVAFQRTKLPDLVNSAGWKNWHDDDPRTAHVTYGEYANTGAGASGKRSFETKLSKPVEIDDVLGSDYATWVNKDYV